MNHVSYDASSFLVGGQRVWLMSGAMHPFRVPPEEWADRLDQFVGGLLNCVEICVPWNLIEPRPGCFDFSGPCDLVHFLELCRERHLYVFLRPGPYICAEWDLGGLPAWLLEEGANLRSSDPVFMSHVERYFNELFIRIAHFQRSVSSDGPIILVQVENEFWMSHPEGLHYLDETRRLLLAAGASVPLTDCNMLYNAPPTLHTINGGWNYPANFQRMRRQFPEQPLFAAELHCGWFTTTARPLAEQHKVERHIFRDSLRYLSRGAMMNRYMFIGGTNFGNWGARAASGEFLTASYDFVAPITEGGGRSEKFYWARLAHRLELLFSTQLAQSPRPCEAVYLHAHPHVITRQTPAGDLVFVFKTIDCEPAEEDVPLIFGRWRRFIARFNPEITVRIIPVDYLVAPGVSIDFCEAQLFHVREVASGCELFLYDHAGSCCEISLNGHTRSIEFPSADEAPALVIWENGIRLRLFNLNQALRFIAVDSADGFEIESPPVAPSVTVAEWQPWRGIGFASSANGSAPVAITDFARLGALGASHEQGIFSFHYTAEASSKAYIYLRDLHDRAHIFVNGILAGIQGADAAATCQPVSVQLSAGSNSVELLVGNWGHDTACYGHADGKGFARAPSLVRPLTLQWTQGPIVSLARREIDDWLISNMIQNVHIDLETVFSLHPVETLLPAEELLHIVIPSQAFPFFVMQNGRLIHASAGRAWSGDILPALGDTLAVAFTGAEPRLSFDFSKVVIAADLIELEPRNLHFASLTPPLVEASQAVIPGQPAWFSGGFRLDEIPHGGLLIDLETQSRGRVWLNGFLLARFWQPSPQSLYWAPAGRLALDNAIVIFDEEGICPPSLMRLFPQSHGPFRRFPEAIFPEAREAALLVQTPISSC